MMLTLRPPARPHTDVAQKLAEARNIYQLRGPMDGSRGVFRQSQEVCLAIDGLKSYYKDSEAHINTFARWHNESLQVMSQQKRDGWHLLVQYGVQELLYFLYGCLADLIDKGEKEKTVEVLVRGMLLLDGRHL